MKSKYRTVPYRADEIFRILLILFFIEQFYRGTVRYRTVILIFFLKLTGPVQLYGTVDVETYVPIFTSLSIERAIERASPEE